jgi:RNA polymerase sigma factor (sigma-70 family)
MCPTRASAASGAGREVRASLSMDDVAAPDFGTEWEQARHRLMDYCRRRSGPSEADDLFQAVALRAWRGYGSFRRQSSFLTWVLRIAEREAIRQDARQRRRDRYEDRTAADVPAVEPVVAAADSDSPDQRWIAGAVEDAWRAGTISDIEHEVVQTRIAAPALTWSAIAEHLGMNANRCAVAHSRAIPKIRVFVFEYAPNRLGGRESIMSAFASAQAGPVPLTPRQIAAFRTVVLERRPLPAARGWAEALRSACAQVIRFLDRD